MDTFLQLSFSGLALGAIYALVALGFVVIYRASEVFNFAQGEFLTLGAFSMLACCNVGIPWGLSLVVACVGTGLVAATIERVVLRRLIGRPVFVTIILTIFVGFILRTILHLAMGVEVRGMPTPWESTGSFELMGAAVLYNSLVTMAAAAAALGLFFALITYTKIGVATRATSQDQEVALALGIPVGRIFATTWFIAGVLGALGGIFLGMFPRQVDVEMGFVALRAFPAVIVGGLDSALGAVIAGLLLGVLEVWAQGYINPALGDFGQNFHEVFPYLVMIVVLVVRPEGLFGTEEVERV